VCCAPPKFPEFALRQARNPGLFAHDESTGAVNGVKGERETNHTENLGGLPAKSIGIEIINRLSKIPAHIEQEYHRLSESG
jgi:hypothetical protein